jgi:hypothetical protein
VYQGKLIKDLLLLLLLIPIDILSHKLRRQHIVELNKIKLIRKNGQLLMDGLVA